jgi:hypothetical protein
VDEANAAIGIARLYADAAADEMLDRIRNHLFDPRVHWAVPRAQRQIGQLRGRSGGCRFGRPAVAKRYCQLQRRRYRHAVDNDHQGTFTYNFVASSLLSYGPITLTQNVTFPLT